jgi:hypothetical protein
MRLLCLFLTLFIPASANATQIVLTGSVEVFSSISPEFPIGTPGSLRAAFDSSVLIGGEVFVAWDAMDEFEHNIGNFAVGANDLSSSTCINHGAVPGCGVVFHGDLLAGAVGQVIIPVASDPRIRLRINFGTGGLDWGDPFSTIEDLDAGVTVASAGYFGLSALRFLINNGLAPPNSANVIDDDTYLNDDVYVRNTGCPPLGAYPKTSAA